MSVQDTAGSAIAFAGIAHMGAAVREWILRSILNCRKTVTLKIAEFDAPVREGGVMVSDAPGLGITVDTAVLGEPVESWS